MSLELQFRPGAARLARAVYRPSDFALRYALEAGARESRDLQGHLDAQLGVKRPKWLCIADTLVLAFEGPQADLVAFDSYTNLALWKPAQSLGTPELVGTGSLHLTGLPIGTDRFDLGVVPRYEYAESEARLRVSFGRAAIRHYRVSTCLVVGIDAKGIATLDLNDLQIEE